MNEIQVSEGKDVATEESSSRLGGMDTVISDIYKNPELPIRRLSVGNKRT